MAEPQFALDPFHRDYIDPDSSNWQSAERMSESPDILEELMAVIQDRKAQLPEASYTTSLFTGGVDKIGAKISEEAREVVEAAAEPGAAGREHLIYEAGDLIYHLWVMLAHRDIGLDEVASELGRRFGVSGLEEKASRGRNEPS